MLREQGGGGWSSKGKTANVDTRSPVRSDLRQSRREIAEIEKEEVGDSPPLSQEGILKKKAPAEENNSTPSKPATISRIWWKKLLKYMTKTSEHASTDMLPEKGGGKLLSTRVHPGRVEGM